MFRNLLVPLDGSRLAEAALPAAAQLARKLDASVLLVHVLERNPPASVHGDAHLSQEEEALRYLAVVAARAFPTEVRTERHVHAEATTDVAKSIAEHVHELGRDLVVLCAHGRGGLRDLLFGPIGRQVLALGRAPVLVLRDKQEQPFDLRRILVPLDAGEAHPGALDAAAALAEATGATLHLLHAVPTPGTLPGEDAAGGMLLPRTTAAVLDIATAQSEERLAGHRKTLTERGLTTSAEVVRGDPATAIVRAARDAHADLIVLGTHGRAGMGAFWARSVADRVYRRTRLPLLLVPAPPLDARP
jgi:nucleotide-binding universal stress UspA family protein